MLIRRFLHFALAVLLAKLVWAQPIVGGTWTWDPPDPSKLPPEVTRSQREANGGTVEIVQSGTEIEMRTPKTPLGRGQMTGSRMLVSRQYPSLGPGASMLVTFQWEKGARQLLWEFDLQLVNAGTLEGTWYVTRAVPEPGGRIITMKERYYAIPVRFHRPMTVSKPPLVNEGPPPIPPTAQVPPQAQVVDIHPIQVVQEPVYEAPKEEIPLVAQRPTAVRVFVSIPKISDQVLGITCTLSWLEDGREKRDSIVADLIRVGDRIWVVPQGKDNPKVFKRWNDARVEPGDDESAERKNQFHMAKSWLEQQGDQYYAFNFTFDRKRLCPARELSLVATLTDKSGRQLDRRIEASTSDFSICRADVGFDMVVLATQTVDGSFNIPRVQNGIKRTNTHDLDLKLGNAWLQERAEMCRQSVLAVFPIPEEMVRLQVVPLKPDPKKPKFAVLPKTHYADAWAGPSSYTDSLEEAYPDADAIMVVSAVGFTVGSSMAVFAPTSAEGWTPANNDRVHWVDQNVSLDTLVAAHEIGHDGRFWGGGHPSAPPIVDAWDAGGYKRERRDISASMAGRGCLMIQAVNGDEKMGYTLKAFISAKEYRKLLIEFTDWKP